MKQINLLRNKKQVATRSVRILEYKLAFNAHRGVKWVLL